MTNSKTGIEKRTLESLLDKAQKYIEDAKFAIDDFNYSNAVISCVALIHVVGNQLGDVHPDDNLKTRVNESLDLIRMSMTELGKAEIETSESYDQIYRIMQFLEKPELLKTIQMPLKVKSLLHRVLGDLCFKEHDYEAAEISYKASLAVKPTPADMVRFKQRGRIKTFKKTDFNTRYLLATSYLEHAKFLMGDLDVQIEVRDTSFMQETVKQIKQKLSLAASTFKSVIFKDRRRTVKRNARINLGHVYLKQLELYSNYPRFLHGTNLERDARRSAERAKAVFEEELAEDSIKQVHRSKAFKHRGSEKDFDSLIFNDPMSDDLQYFMGLLYMSKFVGADKGACEFLKAVSSDSEHYSEARLKLAIALSNIGARNKQPSEEAINILENLVKSESNLDAMVQAGRLYSDYGNYNKALKHYGKAYALAHKSGDNQKLLLQALVGLWTCHRRQSNVEDIYLKNKHRKAASRIMGKIVEVHERVGDLDAVIKQYSEIISAGSKQEGIDVMETLELCYLRKGYLEEILRPINDSISADPDNSSNFFERGLVLYTLGNYTKAAVDFNRALNIKFLRGGSLDEVASLCMLGCSYMNSGRRAYGHKMLKRALVKTYKLSDIDSRFQQDLDPVRQVFTLPIEEVLSFKIKRGLNVAEEFSKSYYMHQKLEKKSLISEPVALIRHKGEPHFVTLILHGESYVSSLKDGTLDKIKRYAVKAIAMMARLHHEVNLGKNKTGNVFKKTKSVSQTWTTALFDSKRYLSLSEFTGIKRVHDAWRGIDRCAKSLDELLYGDKIKDPLLYGVVQGDCHCGNIIDVSRLDYDPCLNPRHRPYVSFIDNDQAHYDLFFSDLYDFLEDIRNQIHTTSLNKNDFVRLYFLFRKSLNDSKGDFKNLLTAAMNSDRKEFMPYVASYGDTDEYVDMYGLYCHVRDPKTFGMFRAYEASQIKSPDQETAALYNRKSSQMLHNLVNNAARISNTYPELKSLKNVWLHYINKGGLGNYLKCNELPVRSSRVRKAYSSLMRFSRAA
ncbi:MAG: tetratricopeptide repeat protein [Nanoarchaeota archaeon]|nr:tetratricopeptide repeat protein [Nanoarchaeota archaeon]